MDFQNAVEGEMDFNEIIRLIYISCDVHSLNAVPVSHLIDYIKPYFLQNLSVLDDLKKSLDPNDRDDPISSERFYEVMIAWSEKTSTSPKSDEDPNMTPSFIRTAGNDLPIHSTPRPSVGEKFVHYRELLNCSNVSGYSLSSSQLENQNDPNKTILEEEIKNLEYQLQKVKSELEMTKQQLLSSEEQNEQLQQDIERLNRRLHAEQQVIEQLQSETKFRDDVREEVNICKKNLDDSKKKLLEAEKNIQTQKESISNLEEEKIKLEKRINILTKQHQKCLNDLFDVKTECETKDQQINEIRKAYDDLKANFGKQSDTIDQLKEENNLLNHHKATLEKHLKSKPLVLGKPIYSLSTPMSPLLHSKSLPSLNLDLCNLNENKLSKDLHSKVLDTSFTSTHRGALERFNPSVERKRISMLSPTKYMDYGWKKEERHRYNEHANRESGDCLEVELLETDPSFSFMNLSTTLFEKNERIAELEREIEKLNEKYAANSNVSSEAVNGDALKTIQAELEKVQNLYTIVSNEKEILQKHNLDVEEELKCWQTKYHEISKQQEQQQKVSTSNTKCNCEENISQLEIMQSELNNLKEKLLIESEISIKAKETISHLKQQNSEQESHKNELLSTICHREALIIKLTEEAKILQNDKDLLDREIQKLNDSKAELELDLITNKKEYNNVLMKFENVDITSARIAKLIVDKNNVILELKQMNQKLQNSLKKTELNLSKKMKHIRQLTDDLVNDMTIKRELWDKEKSLKEKIEELTKLNEQYESLRDLHTTLEVEKNNLQVVYDQELNKNKKLEGRLGNMTNMYNQLKAALAARGLEYNKELTELKEQLKSVCAEKETLNNALCAVNFELIQLKTKTRDETENNKLLELMKLEKDNLNEQLVKVIEEKNKDNEQTHRAISILTEKNNDLDYKLRHYNKENELCKAELRRLESESNQLKLRLTEPCEECLKMTLEKCVEVAENNTNCKQTGIQTEKEMGDLKFVQTEFIVPNMEIDALTLRDRFVGLSYDRILDVPPLDISDFADRIDKENYENLSCEEMKEKVSDVTSEMTANYRDISKRIENQTENLKHKYGTIMVLIEEISHQLRENNLWEILESVFALLMEMKNGLHDLVFNSCERGILVGEKKTIKCFKLLTNYIAVVEDQHKVSTNLLSSSSNSVQSSPIERKSVLPEMKDIIEPIPRKRTLRSCSVTVWLVAIAVLSILIALLLNTNCRMAVLGHQECPLDFVIKRVNTGFPPM